jgi:hypothetical protein
MASTKARWVARGPIWQYVITRRSRGHADLLHQGAECFRRQKRPILLQGLLPFQMHRLRDVPLLIIAGSPQIHDAELRCRQLTGQPCGVGQGAGQRGRDLPRQPRRGGQA